MKYCPYCGSRLQVDTAGFCSECGKSLHATTSGGTSVSVTDTKGDVIGTAVSGSGNVIAKQIQMGGYTVQNNVINLNIKDPQSGEVLELLKKITTSPIQVDTSGTKIENRQVSSLQGIKEAEENISSLLNDVREVENKTGNKIEGIKAGDFEVSKNELLLREYFLKGYRYYYKGDFYNALKWFDEAIKIKPDYLDAWNNKGLALNELGRYEEAVKSFDEAIKIKPDYVNAWSNKGFALVKAGRPEEAIKSLDEAIKIKPNDFMAWNHKGVALQDLGKVREARKYFDQAAKLMHWKK